MADYPLEAARTVRDHARERAEAALAEALRRARDAEATARAASERLEAFRRIEQARMAREQEKLAVCSAAALQREGRYRARRRDEASGLRDALDRALEAEASARAEADRARRALAAASAGAEVLERHRDRWARDEKARGDRADDEARDDLAASRRR